MTETKHKKNRTWSDEEKSSHKEEYGCEIIIENGTLSKKIDMQTRSMYETGSFSMGVTDQQGRTTIRRECTKFYHFVKGGNDAMKNLRRESMFINLLSGLHPLEAEVMCLVKEKNLENKYKISRSIVEEAYPDIEWRDKV